MDGSELLATPLVPNFWRPPTDNDYGANLQTYFALWRNAGPDATLQGELDISPGPEAIVVKATLAIGAAGAMLTVTYTISANGVRVAAQFRPAPKEEGAAVALSGGVAYLRSVDKDHHIDVEQGVAGKTVRARWKDQGEWQAITIHAGSKAPGAPISSGDMVALQATTGKTEAELLVHGLVPVLEPGGRTCVGVTGVRVEATGAPQAPVWKVRRIAGDGDVRSGDEVVLEADGRHLAVDGEGWAAAVESTASPPKWVIELKERAAPPRVGFQGALQEGFQDVQWFGRGPHEAYLDRFASARVGLFHGTIAEQTFKYVRPQENGNKFETRWMALKRAAGGGLLISAATPSPTLSMQCHRYALSDFDGPEDKTRQSCRHGGELVEQAETAFCVDAAMIGLGGIDSWGNKPLPQHMIRSDEQFDWAFHLRPLSKEQTEAEARGIVFSALARTPLVGNDA